MEEILLQLREWDLNPRHLAYEASDLTTGPSRIIYSQVISSSWEDKCRLSSEAFTFQPSRRLAAFYSGKKVALNPKNPVHRLNSYRTYCSLLDSIRRKTESLLWELNPTSPPWEDGILAFRPRSEITTTFQHICTSKLSTSHFLFLGMCTIRR